jgi:hypothetical protein
MPDVNVKVIDGPAELTLEKLPDDIKAELFKSASQWADVLAYTMTAKASGDVTKIRTGKLAGSFKTSKKADERIKASAYSRDPVLNILEHGGDIPPHLIRPDKKRALHFLGTSGETFAAVTHFKGARIPPHSIVQSTFDEKKQEIVEDMTGIIAKASDAP